jgi:hypothetical protein
MAYPVHREPQQPGPASAQEGHRVGPFLANARDTSDTARPDGE